MYSSNGVQIIRSNSSRFYGDDSLILIFDWDATMAKEAVVHQLEELGYAYFHRAKNLLSPQEVQKAVGESFDLLYAPLAAFHVMSLQGIAPCGRADLLTFLVKPFLELHEAIENSVQLHDGAIDAMERLKREHWNSYRVILTQCPWYLGLARTGVTNATRFFSGIVGIRQEKPAFLDAYALEVAFIDRWIMERIGKLDLSKYKIIAGVPDKLCKPNPLHHRVALGSLPGVSNRVICFDDKPRRMSAVAEHLRTHCLADYVHARVSTWEEAGPKDKVTAQFEHMNEIPMIVNKLASGLQMVA